MADSIAQTHVWHGDKGFFVSTINRTSSAEPDEYTDESYAAEQQFIAENPE